MHDVNGDRPVSDTGAGWRIPWESLGPPLALLAVIAVFGVLDRMPGGSGKFLSQRNVVVLLTQMSVVAVAALGMTVVILSGGIDLSIGKGIALSATVLAFGLKHQWPSAAAVAAALAAGCACGAINGALVAFGRIVPFIVTLGTMTIFLGLGNRLANSTTITPGAKLTPAWLQDFSSTQSGWLPVGVFVWMGLAVVVALALRFTVYGRHVTAIGSNERAATLCGVRVAWVKFAVYVLAGLSVGLAGVYQFAMLKIGNPNEAKSLELDVIAAVVIGGASLKGGRASVLGTLCGAALMSVIRSGCDMLSVSNSNQQILIGAIIVTAVAVDQWRDRRAE